ncbi:MAG: HAD-IIIA family hydrolase [Deltaproteobacteria bacterium]|nr:HAD-IIIA family hydrolase [Deltaproteobacteria bacterium]
MRKLPSLASLIALSLVACATTAGEETDDLDVDGDGKADGILIVKKRRSMTAVKCPAGTAKAKVAFFDADSTIRVSKTGVVTAVSATDVNVLPFAAKEIKRLAGEGYVIAVVSNQGGVGTSTAKFTIAEKALALAVSKLRKQGAPVHYFDFAEAYDNFRKPATGMADLLDDKITTKCGEGIDFSKSFMVGDSGYKTNVDGPHPDGRPADDFSNTDRLFAENLDIPFHEPTDFFHWRDYEVFNIAKPWELMEFLDAIDARAEELRADGDEDAATELEDEAASNRVVNQL